ncbi:MAG: small metal-binding protein SmbP [Nitrospirota bacterium]|nr:small metal-binding protein SmbP [Nitrospirota bacterium]
MRPLFIAVPRPVLALSLSIAALGLASVTPVWAAGAHAKTARQHITTAIQHGDKILTDGNAGKMDLFIQQGKEAIKHDEEAINIAKQDMAQTRSARMKEFIDLAQKGHHEVRDAIQNAQQGHKDPALTAAIAGVKDLHDAVTHL